jgi:hypothetical protein
VSVTVVVVLFCLGGLLDHSRLSCLRCTIDQCHLNVP